MDPLKEALARIAALEMENQAIKDASAKQASARLTVKVSSKGGVSVYGLGRWPLTLYASQWARLAAFFPQVEAFCKANADKLATKPERVAA